MYDIFSEMTTPNKKTSTAQIIDCSKPDFKAAWSKAQKLTMQFNNTPPDQQQTCQNILSELLGTRGKHLSIAPGFRCDYGTNIHIGNNTEINFNCTILDCATVTIGQNVLIGPNVQIYTASHPIKASDRITPESQEKGNFGYCKLITHPIEIGDNVWIGGGSIILPGVTIGNNSTIGAGSVVTHSIPPNCLAYGNPCRVIREI